MRIFIVTLIIAITFSGCSSKDEIPKTSDLSSDWLIDEADITGQFSLFPLAINPDFDSVNNINLYDDQLVGVIHFGLQTIVYPYVYTFETEIINSDFNGQKYAFSYCPQTKSAIAFKRNQIFRASGYLYKDNLAPWDVETESIWSQMLIKGIKGDGKNKRFNTIPVLETTWSFVKTYFPYAKVLAGSPSLNKNTSSKIYNKPPDDEGDDGDSDENKPTDNELVYGIIDNFDNVNIYKYSDFSNNLIVKKISNQDYIIIGDQSKRYINAFQVDNANDFEVLENELPFIIKHKNGIKYDILGVGSNGSILKKPKYAFVAVWWAWEDFYSKFSFVKKGK